MRRRHLTWALAPLLLAACHAGVGATLRTAAVPASAAPVPSAPAVAAKPPAAVSTMAEDQGDFSPDQLIVALTPGTSAAALFAKPEARGLTLLREMPLNDRSILTLRVPAEELAAARTRLATLPEVARIQRNSLAYAHSVPNDPQVGEQWAHKKQFANTEGAWDKIAGVDQSKTAVAMIDTGIDKDHEEFAGRIIGMRNVVAGKDPNNLFDQVGHGTLTAGIMGATGNNGKGGAGVAWGVKIVAVRADDIAVGTLCGSSFTLGDILAGLKYACDFQDPGGAKVRVINMSLGENRGGVQPLYAEAVAYARRKGILVVASTGNEGSNVVGTPANAPGVVAVGSTSRHLDFETVSPFSNYGDRLDLVAPGAGIFVPVPGTSNCVGVSFNDQRNYAYASGTSEAAPYVSGVAALVFAKYDPNNASLATPEKAAEMVDKVRAHLLKSVDDLGVPGWDPSFGAGRINAEKALTPASI